MIRPASVLLLSAVALLPACGDEGDTVILAPSAPASGTIFVLNNANGIASLSPSAPADIESLVIVNGLGSQNLERIKFNPLTRELVGLTDGGNLYAIDPQTGDAAWLYNLTVGFTGTLSFDFHPATAVLSMQSGDEDRVFINPDGTFVIGSDLSPAGNVVASAYAPGGTLYGIDLVAGTASLVTIAPNSAVAPVAPIGALFANLDIDISAGGTAYMVYQPNVAGSTMGLYTLNLATGATTRIGNVVLSQVRSMTVAP